MADILKESDIWIVGKEFTIHLITKTPKIRTSIKNSGIQVKTSQTSLKFLAFSHVRKKLLFENKPGIREK